ncbi:Nuclear transport factor 2 [Linum grandiflorum]
MSSPYAMPVTAAQVGTYFVRQYYEVLQSQPSLAHQFYNDSSTMLRIDGSTRESYSKILDIHSLIMCLNYTAIEIKTAHALESWNCGVLVMVSGHLQSMNFGGTRKFVETFFLAPQEKGYFVLNDVFHFIEEEQLHRHPGVLLAQRNLDSNLNAPPTAISEPVSNYLFNGETQSKEFLAATDFMENGQVDNYALRPQKQFQQVPEPEHIAEHDAVEESNGSFNFSANARQDHLPPTLEEPAGEPQKHTYASILRVAKEQPALPATAERNHSSPATAQTTNVTSNSVDNYTTNHFDEPLGAEDEDICGIVWTDLPRMK